MDQTDPRWAPYRAALQRHGPHPVVCETTVADLLVLTGALQLALRLPALPASTRAHVEAFVAAVSAGVARLDPVLGEVARRGHDPAADVPAGDAPAPAS
jgi:hypothetical protein